MNNYLFTKIRQQFDRPTIATATSPSLRVNPLFRGERTTSDADSAESAVASAAGS